jgi:hypothetical protein
MLGSRTFVIEVIYMFVNKHVRAACSSAASSLLDLDLDRTKATAACSGRRIEIRSIAPTQLSMHACRLAVMDWTRCYFKALPNVIMISTARKRNTRNPDRLRGEATRG